jgi:hypothetical protein
MSLCRKDMRPSTAQPVSATKPPNRSFGRRSPLDRMPQATKDELRTRCQSDETFLSMQTWLKTEHRVRVSQTSLSDWWKRQQFLMSQTPPAAKESPRQSVCHGAFEITVTAPGATSIQVTVRPASLSQA